MTLYDGNGQTFETESNVISIKASNTGLSTTSNSFFGTEEKSVTGDGTSSRLELAAVAYPNTKIETFVTFFGIIVECTAPCAIRLYNSSIYGSNAALIRQGTIALKNVSANTKTYICGVTEKTTTTAGASRSLMVVAEFDSNAETEGVVLKASKGVAFDATNVFGSDVPDAESIAELLSKYTDRYITTSTEIWSSKIVNTIGLKKALRSDSPVADAYARLTEDKNFEAGGAINPDWDGWNYVQNSYGNKNTLCPIPNQFHGKVSTDAQISVIPLFSHWGRRAVTTGAGDWGGHVFHGWNDAQTYRLTLMASGGMTSPDNDFQPREDEFCIHVFSPTGAYANPIGLTESESENRITQDIEDIFSGSAYYGRIRIGADRTDEGFLFRAKSLVCFGRVDVNGQKFILGDQTSNVPATSSSSGENGQMAFDSDYLYVCVATNTWKRIALSTW